MSEAKPDRFDEPEYEEPAASEQEAVSEPPAPTEVVEEEVKPVPTVPLAALNEERHRTREMRAAHAAEIEALRQQTKALFDEQKKAQEQARQAQKTDQFQKDPLGGLYEELRALKATQEGAISQQQAVAAQQRQVEQFTLAVASQVQEFTKTAPDYPDALQHLVNARKAELMSMGVPDFQLDAMIDQESIGLAQTALQRGMNPGQMVYELAKQRGFTGKAKPASPKLETIEKGQKASQTLSGGGGDNNLSIPDIANMDDKEFDKMWAEMEKSAKKTSRH